MKSIKPGRGPSMMGAFGSAAVSVFGIIWTIMAMSMGAPVFFALFGIIFVVMGIAQTAYNFKNATGKERFSAFDITDSSEEPDPLNEFFTGNRTEAENMGAEVSGRADNRNSVEKEADAFCPYCGAEAETDYQYCAKCGRKLP